MRHLRMSSPDATLPPGFEVLEEPGRRRVKLRTHRYPDILLGELHDRASAIELARALVIPFDSLIDSFRHPDGLLAFPQG